MLNTDDYLFGNSALHERFCVAIEILAKAVSCAPRAIALRQIEHSSGRPLALLESLCISLAQGGLLRRNEAQHDSWVLSCCATTATLDDAFRSVIGDVGQNRRTLPSTTPQASVALLLRQATLTVNQSVSRQLRQFSLDSLRAPNMLLAPIDAEVEVACHLPSAALGLGRASVSDHAGAIHI